MRNNLLDIPALRLARWLPLAGLLVALSAIAYPSQVADILRKAGQSGVVRAPGTVDDATKAQLDQIAHDAASKTGAKVYLIVLKQSDNPSDYAGVYSDLGM